MTHKDIETIYNFYEIPFHATPEEIKKKYLQIARTTHPDQFSCDPILHAEAETKMKNLNEAYQLIKNAPLFKLQTFERNTPQPKKTITIPAISKHRIFSFIFHFLLGSLIGFLIATLIIGFRFSRDSHNFNLIILIMVITGIVTAAFKDDFLLWMRRKFSKKPAQSSKNETIH
jgi:curved DNA-binding protein CbpA